MGHRQSDFDDDNGRNKACLEHTDMGINGKRFSQFFPNELYRRSTL